jgi:hypothetical protein
MNEERNAAILKEHEAFAAQLPHLMESHQGEWVLFKSGSPVAFFPSVDAAFSRGVELFGTSDPFLLEQVKPRSDQPTCINWACGIL